MSVGDGDLGSVESIERVYESGKYYTAYLAAQRSGLFDVARNDAATRGVLAGRVLRANGAPRRGRKLLLDTWRRHRHDAHAIVFAGYELANDAPLVALQWMDGLGELVDASDEQRADWLIVRAMCLAQLRDFRAADRAWQASRALHVDPWTWCVRAIIDDQRDRRDEAAAAIEQALHLSPWYRPAIELAARIHIRARRAPEARALLVSAVEQLESASTHLILSMLQREAGELDDAIASLHRAIALAPAMERQVHDHVAQALAYSHYLRGDIDLSVRLMRLTNHAATRTLADRIATSHGARRKLAVPHVPQDHRTCAPATLTAIAELWGEQVDHAELAEEICHDGTPAGSERKWADERGFVTRQLTVTWEAARGLVDAGIPIALTTSFTLGAHLQPVAGYDERRRTLLVSEPGAAGLVELDWDELAKDQAPFGPRGMVFVPKARASLLDGLELPDAPLYDHHYAIEMALQRHDRAGAQAAFDTLVATAPAGHYLCHHARRALANYDGDERGSLAWVSALRERHTSHPFLRTCELTSLQGHASDERRAELAHGLLADHSDDAAVLVTCGRFLFANGDLARAVGAATRALKLAPQHPAGYRLAADLAWIAGDRARATRLYRFATCLAEGDEGAAWSYFVAALITGEVDNALDHLRDRVSRMNARSAAPAQTLCDAYRAVGRAHEGTAILEDAVAAHPDDGLLLLVVAEQYRLAGDLVRASATVDAAKGKVSSLVWRRGAAELAVQRGQMTEALALRRGLVEEDPLDVASQYSYVALLERSGNTDAARAHVLAMCERFPFHIPLAQLYEQVLRDREPDAARAHLEAVLERQPRSAWALYRLSDCHVQRGDLVRARELLVRARACTDDAASGKVAEAALDTREGKRDSAMALLHEAITIDVDTGGAVASLLALARDGSEARALLETIGAEVTRQGSGGTGLDAYANGLQAWFDPLTALARLRELRIARPHQWQSWRAEIDALLGAGRLDDATELATAASRRYGHDPRAWRQLSEVARARGDGTAQIAALERTLELDPRASEPMRRLADAHLAAEDAVRARAVMERAIAEEPLTESNHGFLARVAKLEGDDAAARAHVQRGIELAPEYSWAWSRLLEWSEDETPVLALARKTIERYPRAIASRLVLAKYDPELSVDERVSLLDEAIAIAPDSAELYDTKAVLLVEHERWDEALAACRPTFWGTSSPTTLLGRAAWVRYLRGEREEAISDMLAVIRRTPSYGWGIQQVLDWGKAIRAPIATAERLVEAAPESALAHAVLGEALREADRLDEAERCYARALEIDATDQLARLGLFDVRYDQGKYDAAAPLLDALPPENPYVMSRRVQILTAMKRLDDADTAMARMLRRGVEDPTPIEEAMVGYRKAGARPRVEALLDALLAEPDASRAVARAWWAHVGRHRSTFGRWRQIRRLPRSQATTLAANYHVEEYGDQRDFMGLIVFLLLNYKIARAWTDVWGSVGYALLCNGRRWLMRWWMRDHSERDGVKPWMLNNLARAFINSDNVARAMDVCRQALRLPADSTTHATRLLLAPVEALTDAEAAARTVSAARHANWTDEERFLGALSEALIAYRRGARDDRGRDELTDACRVLWTTQGARATSICVRVYSYVMLQIGRTIGRHRSKWLRTMRRLSPR